MRARGKSTALIWIGSIVAVLVIAVILAVVFFNWNWLRGPLESRLSAATGKQVRITGPITGERSWTPTITIAGVKITEPHWQPNPEVANIDKITATVELKKLLAGKLSIPSLNIEKPVVRLERRGDKANWDIATEATGPSNRHGVPVIGDVIVTDGHISFNNPDKHVSLEGMLSVMKGNGGPNGEPFTLDGKGTYQHAPFTIKLSGDSIVHMREKNEPYKVDVKASLGTTRILIGGTIGDPIKMTGLALGVQLEGQNAADLYPYIGIPAPITPPYHLGGTLDRFQKDVWTFRDFGGTVGASDLEGSLVFDLSKPRLAMHGALNSRNLNIADFGVVFGVPTKPGANEPVGEHQKRLAADYAASDRLLPNVPLEVDAVRNVDLDVMFKAVKVTAQDLPMEHIDMHIVTQDGVMKLDPVQVGIAGGTLRGTVVIDARGNPVKSDSDIRFADFAVERFLKPSGGEASISGEIDGRLRFKGDGDTLAKALGTADGVASFIIADGSISKLDASLLGLDVAKALGTLISGDKKIALRCTVTDFEIKQGVMTPRLFVIDTSDSTITGQGSINLADETMDISVKGKPKKVTLSLRGPILVKGKFRDPHIGVGAEAVARAGGSVVLGALLTPIAAIITFIDSGKKRDADCQGLEASAKQEAASAPPVNKNPPPPKRTARTPQAKPTRESQSDAQRSGGK